MMQQHLSEFYLEHLQPTWLPSKRSQARYSLLGGLFVGLFVGLLGGLGYALLASRLVFGLGYALVFGLGYALVFGLVFGLAAGLSEGFSTSQITDHLRIRHTQGIRSSVPI